MFQALVSLLQERRARAVDRRRRPGAALRARGRRRAAAARARRVAGRSGPRRSTRSTPQLACPAGTDLASAFESTLKAAEQGDVKAQAAPAMMYANGKGVRQNYAEAGKWWVKAAEGGDLVAARHAWNFFRNGEGVDRNTTIANQWAKVMANRFQLRARQDLRPQPVQRSSKRRRDKARAPATRPSTTTLGKRIAGLATPRWMRRVLVPFHGNVSWDSDKISDKFPCIQSRHGIGFQTLYTLAVFHLGYKAAATAATWGGGIAPHDTS